MKLFRDFYKALSFLVRNTRGVRYSKLLVVLVLLTGILSGLSNTGLIAVINTALNSSDGLGRNAVWAFIGLSLLLMLTRFSSSALLGYLNTKATLELNTRMCRQILAAPLRRLEEIGAPRLLAMLASDIGAISNILPILPAIVINLAIVVGCLTYLFWLSPSLLVALICLMALSVFSYQLPLSKAQLYARRLREEGNFLYSHYRSIVEGTKELKLHRRRGITFYERLFQPTASRMADLGFRSSVMQALSGSWGVFLSFLPIGLLVFVLPTLNNIRVEVLTGYTLIILYMTGPLQSIISLIAPLTHASVAVDNIARLQLTPDVQALRARETEPEPQPNWKELTLEGVTHTYYREKEESNFTLGPIDLTFKQGSLVYLTGKNGSGKTTLAKLITGLYEPESGAIRFNGQVIDEQNIEDYRRNFSMLFSDFFLFEDLLGVESANLDERAHEHLVRLQLDHKVQVQDGRLSTTELSQGQRKRLALLNAFLEDRPIYIFDEWASDQDPMFRDVFYYDLLPELKARGKTVIVISHDDRYYHLGDRLIRLEDGQVELDQPTGETNQTLGSINLPAAEVIASSGR